MQDCDPARARTGRDAGFQETGHLQLLGAFLRGSIVGIEQIRVCMGTLLLLDRHRKDSARR